MKRLIPLFEIGESDRAVVGGKAYALSRLLQSGVNAPPGTCITTLVYREYVTSTGLQERIILELARKRFSDMRWEEIWDASLRIRNMFVTTPLPDRLRHTLEHSLTQHLRSRPVAIRSSAPGEDEGRTSFAGLHESYLNISGMGQIMRHIQLVWSSLWSNRALLYRKELHLDVESSTMAVLVQEIVPGDKSGIVFGRNPVDPSQAVVEAVYGLNQGLVDGSIEPDRWIADRSTGDVVSHTPANRLSGIFPSKSGVETRPLGEKSRETPPLSNEELGALFHTANRLESLFGDPQDVEWTFMDGDLYVLQSRPITTAIPGAGEDSREYYLGLQKSYDNLQKLRVEIENEIIPGMMGEAESLMKRPLDTLSDESLAGEIEYRSSVLTHWNEVYESRNIPFAHGVRLFGQAYNDTVAPEDPFEFITLLRTDKLQSMRRNGLVTQLSEMIRTEQGLEKTLNDGSYRSKYPRFSELLDTMISGYGGILITNESEAILFLKNFSARENRPDTSSIETGETAERLEKQYVDAAGPSGREFALGLLDLARASYRLRDDDNIYLGRIEQGLLQSVEEGKKRVAGRIKSPPGDMEPGELARALRDPGYVPAARRNKKVSPIRSIRARQLRGQPASRGVASGPARVIRESGDLFKFKAGEILVTDAIDPNATFVAPLAAGIVERRGGMLIHGAIIAREYGIPCITGIPDAVRFISTGDRLTVDGYLGIVTIHRTRKPGG